MELSLGLPPILMLDIIYLYRDLYSESKTHKILCRDLPNFSLFLHWTGWRFEPELASVSDSVSLGGLGSLRIKPAYL